MKIVNPQRDFVTLLTAAIVIFLFGLATAVVVVVVGELAHLDDWAKGWAGGFIAAMVLAWLLKDNTKSRRS
jgi:sugar phosphate permease